MGQKTDKFLIGIVASILLLVVVAFVVVLNRPEPTYQSDETPTGVAHNYLLALQRQEYERAYRYLSPDISGYPQSADIFINDVRDNRWWFDQSVALEVVSGETDGVDSSRTYVTVRKTSFYQGDLFNNGQSTNTFTMQLKRNPQSAEWQIVQSDDYWNYCWSQGDGCK
jgi:hypothetical protein